MLRLVVTSGNQRGKVFDLEPSRKYVIGRGTDADFAVLDIMVSRAHTEITVDAESRAQLCDIGSANGIILNGSDTKRSILKDGDRILVGESEILVSYSHAAAGVGVDTHAATADTDMTEFMSTLLFCEKCNESIPATDVQHGRAAEIDGRYFCMRCVKEMSDAQKE